MQNQFAPFERGYEMNRYGVILVILILVTAGLFLVQREWSPAQAEAPPAPQKAIPETAPQKAPPANSAEAGIKSITAEYVKAFNAKDAKAAASLWTDDGEYIGVDGDASRGRAAIEKSLAEEFQASPKATIEAQVTSVRPIGQNTAFAEGTIKTKSPGGEISDTQYSAIHVLENGQWRAASVRESVADTSQAEITKSLDWMVGEWTAKGNRGTIAMSYTWDENKAFLHGKYSITKDGKTVSSGTQVIGRNPTGGLRSWSFDSTGSFSNSLWERDGNRWIDESTGILPDGTTINSVNILIPLGPDTFTWQTAERTADGVPVTPLPPIKVTRVKPSK
jgi:uncharacterized protein (TIGR02246 family)